MKKLYIFIILSISISSIGFSQQEKPLLISKLTNNIYIYTTYNTYNGEKMPANGLYVTTDEGVILIETPWDESQFQPLLDSIESKHHKKVMFSISTHSHEDRTAGIEYYKSKGIKTYSSAITDSISKITGKNRAAFLFNNDTTFKLGTEVVKTYFPGKGHTPDNIVIWFEKQKVLYGGCFIKSSDATDLGNLNDATPDQWLTSVNKVKMKFKSPKYIIPGHDDWKDGKGLFQTEFLLKQYLKNTH